MSPSDSQPDPSISLSSSLRSGLDVGLRVGVLAGLVDAAGAAMGFDSEFFVLETQLRGLSEALPSASYAWGGLTQNFGCLAAAACLYGLAAGLGGVLLAALLHPVVLARRTVVGSRRLLLGVLLGLWVSLAVWWWTRPVVLAGYSSLHPLRLAALAGMLLVGQGVGVSLAKLGGALPHRARVAAPFLAAGLILAGGLYLATDAPGRSELGAPNPRTEDLPNVLIFVVDALRAESTGQDDIDTPVLDALAERGVTFERAMVQAPFTWSSFGSILTGKYPRRHGLVKMAPGVRMRPNVTFPFYLKGATRQDGVQLQEEDYVGAAFMTGTLSHGSGLLRGFDYYCEALVGHGLVDVHSRWSRFRSKLLPWLFWSKLTQRVDREFVATTAVNWLESNPEQRFVSMVHYYSTHTPYDPIEPHRSRYVDPDYQGPFTLFDAVHRIAIEDGTYDPTEADVQQIRDLYHGGVTMADAMIGRVLDQLQAQGRLDNTIVVVTSDHGEELGEHGLWEHNFMYQTNLHIPLMVSWPGGGVPQGKKVPALVETVDLFPTLCELMGLELPDARGEARELLDGVSLVPLMKGQKEEVKRYSFAENGRFVSIQSLSHKLIIRWELLEDGAWEAMLEDPEVERPRLYDLVEDPTETRNRFEEQVGLAGKLYLDLKEWSDTMPINRDEVLASDRDLRAEQLLQTLGYAGGVGQDMDDK